MSQDNLEKTDNRPVVLSVAGSDCSGMAGIQMDTRVISALGAHAATAITANTAQSQTVFHANPLETPAFKQQLDAALELDIAAIKTGVLCNAKQVQLLAYGIASRDVPLIIDPVLTSTNGGNFCPVELVEEITTVLIPLSTIITPNLAEAEQLTGLRIESEKDVETAAEKLVEMGAKNVLVKGGHAQNPIYSQDYFRGQDRNFWLSSPRNNTENSRGTGCALSSAIATALAQGNPIEDAVVIGKMAINQGLRNSYAVLTLSDSQSNVGPVSITHFPNCQEDLPILTDSYDVDFNQAAFPSCVHGHTDGSNDKRPLGLYPCVDSADWIERLIPQGITTIQLRNKTLSGDALEQEVARSIAIAKQTDCRLFINDHWELAIKHGAYGVHLGQEDLDTADVSAIRNAGLRLGLSSHCHYEVARAHRYKPSYMACGPVYHTNTKQMPWIPHNLEGLSYWKDTLDYPLVGIGGITQERVAGVAQTGVSGVSLITAITLADDPDEATRQMIETIDRQPIDQAHIGQSDIRQAQ